MELPTNAPHTRCNWILDKILIGAFPLDEHIKDIEKIGVTVFVNLTDTKEYNCNVTQIHKPIRNGASLEKKDLILFIDQLLELYKSNILYIHCNGGHGRAGMIGSILVGKILNIKACEAIKHIEKCRESRQDNTRNFIPTPETNTQIKSIVNLLGLEHEQIPPDRRDKSWLKRVKKERLSKSSNNTDVTNFYDSKEIPLGCLSNYYTDSHFKLYIDNINYPSTEHYYQSAKFIYPNCSNNNKQYAELIRTCSTCNKARILGLQKTGGGYKWRTDLNDSIKKSLLDNVKVREDWDTVKMDIMYKCVYEKFSQNIHLWIRGGKGHKDRMTVLSPILLHLLRRYYKKYRP